MWSDGQRDVRGRAGFVSGTENAAVEQEMKKQAVKSLQKNAAKVTKSLKSFTILTATKKVQGQASTAVSRQRRAEDIKIRLCDTFNELMSMP